MSVASTSTAAVTARRAPRKRRLPAGWLTPWLFLAPALFFYLGFLVVPMAQSLYISFFDWDGLSKDMSFVGLRNYIEILFTDEVTRTALVNNIWWTLGSLTVPTSIGLVLALMLNRKLPGTTLLRTIFYLPQILPLIAIGIIWSWMYNPNFGALNAVLQAVGLGAWKSGWLSNFDQAFPAVFVTFVWGSVGFPMIIYLAGLQAINKEYYEAARVDGANAWQQFLHVTWPGLTETHIIVMSLSVIGGFKVFDLVYTMTYGGPGRVTQVLGTWMYFQSFQYSHAGYGAAIAWVIAIIVLVIAIPYIRQQSRT